MNPAFSVIFFTTLSGAGYGLLSWAALASMTGGIPARALLVALLLGMLLCGAGLLASFWHLGKPLRAWRAFSQWRTSWLSREGVLAVASFVPALLLAAAMLPALLDGSAKGGMPALNLAGHAIAIALLACATATVYSTAMIYASLKPIPAWRHPLVLPGYLLFALLTGGLPMLLASVPRTGGLEPVLPFLLLAIALGLLLLKLAYWRAIDRTPLPHARGDAIGLPHRRASVFERPHTEATYITREMAFAVARRHARALRIVATLLFALAPVACLLLAWAQPGLAWPMPVATGCALAGAFLERWLFFAQARHLVTLYY